jgi:hypothetical protein
VKKVKHNNLKGCVLMRLLFVSLVCLGGLLFLTSCNGMSGTSGPGSNATEITRDRLEISFPEKCRFVLAEKTFVNGVKTGGGGSSWDINKGRHKFTITKWVDGKKFRISVTDFWNGHSFGFDHQGFGSWIRSLIPIEQISTEKQPIYIFAANKKGEIEEFSSTGFDIDELVKKYDLAIVIYASVK